MGRSADLCPGTWRVAPAGFGTVPLRDQGTGGWAQWQWWDNRRAAAVAVAAAGTY